MFLIHCSSFSTFAFLPYFFPFFELLLLTYFLSSSPFLSSFFFPFHLLLDIFLTHSSLISSDHILSFLFFASYYFFLSHLRFPSVPLLFPLLFFFLLSYQILNPCTLFCPSFFCFCSLPSLSLYIPDFFFIIISIFHSFPVLTTFLPCSHCASFLFLLSPPLFLTMLFRSSYFCSSFCPLLLNFPSLPHEAVTLLFDHRFLLSFLLFTFSFFFFNPYIPS